MTKTAPYDSAELLNSPKAIEFYMEEAMESGDPQLIAHALGVVARARSMTDIARKSGVSRESLYRSLSPTGKPEFGTVMSVLRALGLGLSVHTVGSARGKKGATRPSSNKRTEGQREMLLPISGSGKRAAKEEKKPEKKAQKPVRAPAARKKAG